MHSRMLSSRNDFMRNNRISDIPRTESGRSLLVGSFGSALLGICIDSSYFCLRSVNFGSRCRTFSWTLDLGTICRTKSLDTNMPLGWGTNLQQHSSDGPLKQGWVLEAIWGITELIQLINKHNWILYCNAKATRGQNKHARIRFGYHGPYPWINLNNPKNNIVTIRSSSVTFDCKQKHNLQ